MTNITNEFAEIEFLEKEREYINPFKTINPSTSPFVTNTHMVWDDNGRRDVHVSRFTLPGDDAYYE